jgi:hypothetical protein
MFSGAALLALVSAASLLPAQTAPAISVRILDGRTGKPVTPDNVLVRVDHHDSLHMEWLKMVDDGTIAVSPAAGASLLSLQGTYNASMMIYINCDAGMDPNTDKLYWYSISEILAKGMVTPDKCYKGKFDGKFNVTAKPGEFVFFVRPRDRHDSSAY